MAYAELQYKLVQEGMTVEQIDYLNSSERLAQAVTMSLGSNLINFIHWYRKMHYNLVERRYLIAI
jgi:hypothetical protein